MPSGDPPYWWPPQPVWVTTSATIQETPAWATEIIHLLKELLRKDAQIMASLDDVLNDVTSESTVIDSLSTLVAGIQKQLADALSGATLPAPVQAKVDAIFAAAETNKQKLADAVTANTPAATPTP